MNKMNFSIENVQGQFLKKCKFKECSYDSPCEKEEREVVEFTLLVSETVGGVFLSKPSVCPRGAEFHPLLCLWHSMKESQPLGICATHEKKKNGDFKRKEQLRAK